MMSITHTCDHPTNENHCTWLATMEGPLLSASFIAQNQAHTGECGCKDIEEHIEKTVQYYFGKKYKDYTPSDPKIADIKKEIIKFIRLKIEKDTITAGLWQETQLEDRMRQPRPMGHHNPRRTNLLKVQIQQSILPPNTLPLRPRPSAVPRTLPRRLQIQDSPHSG
jgi:hypothetical protein